MRLRRETGDFSIKKMNGEFVSIPAGLSAEDLLGVVINSAGLHVVTSVTENQEDKLVLGSDFEVPVIYDPETGELSTIDDNSDVG